MKAIAITSGILISSIGILFSQTQNLNAADSPEQVVLKSEMNHYLDDVASVFHAQYASVDWKKEHFGWDIDSEIQKLKDEVNATNDITILDYQRILREFFNSTRDYHVSCQFLSTAQSTLPFQIKGAEGRYFIVYIDRSKLDTDSFPYSEGDELVSFDGRPVGEVVAEVKKEVGYNNDATDQALAEIYLTRRTGRLAMNMPQGVITLGIKPNGSNKVKLHQLIWDHSDDDIGEPGTRGNAPAKFVTTPAKFSILHREMVTPLQAMLKRNPRTDNAFLLATRKSYLPDLGDVKWATDDSNPFYAYEFQTADGHTIGYIHIAEYMGQDLNSFADIIKKFEAETDAVVLDQLNNPGGSVFYLYALASMLTDQAITTPRHHMAITQADVYEASQLAKILPFVQTSDDARQLLGPSIDGYPVTHQVALFILDYARFIMKEWKAGNRITDPYFLFGVDEINPAPVHLTKPILMLTNELDFSGGDFFPAILQDNKRVTIMGTRTAGAGGYILETQFPNSFGVDLFTVTGSLAERVDANPIENLGVKPDIDYSVTARDLQSNFVDYKAAILKALTGMLPAKPAVPNPAPSTTPSTQPSKSS